MADGIGKKLLPPALQIRRIFSEQLETDETQNGEPVFVADEKKLYIGNGSQKVLVNPGNIGAFENDVGYIKVTDDKIMDGGTFK